MGLFNKRKRRRIGHLIPTVLALLLIGVIVLGIVYINDYYRADDDAIEAFAQGTTINITKQVDGTMVFMPDSPRAGLIFYPGGKVEYNAYAPLMQRLAEHGIACVLVKMPANLAVLDVDAANGIPEKFPEIQRWYIGGHSLGGSMASSYVSGHTGFEGLVLLGSYSTADISNTSLKVISIYGSEDGVMNREKYEQYKVNLPADFEQIVILGGNHAMFGMYGAQDGDGEGTVTNIEQIDFTATQISDFIK